MGSGSFGTVPLREVLATEVTPRPKKGAEYAVVAGSNVSREVAEKFVAYYFKEGVPVDIYLSKTRGVKRMSKGRYGVYLGMCVIPKPLAKEKGYVWIDSIALDEKNGEIAVNGYTPDREGMDFI